MTRLWDRLLRSGTKHVGDLSLAWVQNYGWAPNNLNPFDEAVVVNINNAAAYWWEHKPGWPPSSTLSPPFQIAFYEYKPPPSCDYWFDECGFVSVARDLHDPKQREQWESFKPHATLHSPDAAANVAPGQDARWVVENTLFVDSKQAGGIGGPLGTWYTDIAEDGELISSPYYSSYHEGSYDPDHPERIRELYSLGSQMLVPVLFAINLMHCNNVVVDQVTPPHKLSKKHNRRYGRPLTRYHTLRIGPIGNARAARNGSTSLSPAKSWHIARGHFATYTKENPLFGKYTGTFWRPQHVRGSRATGEVHKDYEVLPTKQSRIN